MRHTDRRDSILRTDGVELVDVIRAGAKGRVTRADGCGKVGGDEFVDVNVRRRPTSGIETASEPRSGTIGTVGVGRPELGQGGTAGWVDQLVDDRVREESRGELLASNIDRSEEREVRGGTYRENASNDATKQSSGRRRSSRRSRGRSIRGFAKEQQGKRGSTQTSATKSKGAENSFEQRERERTKSGERVGSRGLWRRSKGGRQKETPVPREQQRFRLQS